MCVCVCVCVCMYKSGKYFIYKSLLTNLNAKYSRVFKKHWYRNITLKP